MGFLKSFLIGLFKPFFPDRYCDSTYHIDYEALFKHGIRALIFDIDNTLVPHDAPADQRSIELFERLHKIGFSCLLLSNNKEPRVKSFAGKVKSLYIHKAGKPGKKGYIRAMKLMGTDTDSTAFIGDQIFTDVWGAKRVGMKTILVHPIDKKEEIQIVLKRFIERPILWAYRRDQEG